MLCGELFMYYMLRGIWILLLQGGFFVVIVAFPFTSGCLIIPVASTNDGISAAIDCLRTLALPVTSGALGPQ